MPPRPPPPLKSSSRSKSKSNLESSSPSSSSPSVEILTQTQASLSPLLPILQAVAHRHRNQHSSSHWWRAFGLLRRATRSLAASLLRRPSKSDDELPSVVQARWMASHIVPRTYVAFTQLAADNQHAPLGLMLLAVLARISRLLSDLVPSNHTSSNPNPSSSSAAVTQTSTQGPDTIPSSDNLASPHPNVDMGIVISRHDLAISNTTNKTSAESMDNPASSKDPSNDIKPGKSAKNSSNEVTKDTSRNGNGKKKKKKAGDAFSSLFGSL
ncbi:hypothetical protein BGZ63DRAFT_427911 [Mariannaea sp. PMI_226]|nr:hypothetical protein BGZ63DRAFT_427911 [Mariannaea sp. PMI_226]